MLRINLSPANPLRNQHLRGGGTAAYGVDGNNPQFVDSSRTTLLIWMILLNLIRELTRIGVMDDMGET